MRTQLYNECTHTHAQHAHIHTHTLACTHASTHKHTPLVAGEIVVDAGLNVLEGVEGGKHVDQLPQSEQIGLRDEVLQGGPGCAPPHKTDLRHSAQTASGSWPWQPLDLRLPLSSRRSPCGWLAHGF